MKKPYRSKIHFLLQIMFNLLPIPVSIPAGYKQEVLKYMLPEETEIIENGDIEEGIPLLASRSISSSPTSSSSHLVTKVEGGKEEEELTQFSSPTDHLSSTSGSNGHKENEGGITLSRGRSWDITPIEMTSSTTHQRTNNTTNPLSSSSSSSSEESSGLYDAGKSKKDVGIGVSSIF